MTINAIGKVSQIGFKGVEASQETKKQIPEMKPDTFEKQSKEGTNKKKSKAPLFVALTALTAAIGIGLGIKKGKIKSPFGKKGAQEVQEALNKAGDEVAEVANKVGDEVAQNVQETVGKAGDEVTEAVVKVGDEATEATGKAGDEFAGVVEKADGEIAEMVEDTTEEADKVIGKIKGNMSKLSPEACDELVKFNNEAQDTVGKIQGEIKEVTALFDKGTKDITVNPDGSKTLKILSDDGKSVLKEYSLQEYITPVGGTPAEIYKAYPDEIDKIVEEMKKNGTSIKTYYDDYDSVIHEMFKKEDVFDIETLEDGTKILRDKTGLELTQLKTNKVLTIKEGSTTVDVNLTFSNEPYFMQGNGKILEIAFEDGKIDSCVFKIKDDEAITSKFIDGSVANYALINKSGECKKHYFLQGDSWQSK